MTDQPSTQPSGQHPQNQQSQDQPYPQYPYYLHHPGFAPYPPVPPAPSRRRARGLVAAAGAGALVAGGALVGAGVVSATMHRDAVTGSGTAAAPTVPVVPANPGQGSTGQGSTGQGPTGQGPTGQGSAAQAAYSTATAAQQVGVVDIDTVLGYSGGRAAGTGMVIGANGEILTNNHVVRGATAISVTVVTTGRTYTASVVGTDPTDDVAVLQLQGASGLTTAHLGDSGGVKVGDTVTGVGNAGGAGGTPQAAAGTVTALDRSITAADEDGSNAETLDGLIETDAAIQAGDSGGPLYDSAGEVVGMDTAASTSAAGYGPSATATAAEAYAIPIDDAISIAHRIEGGQASSTVHLGLPAFLGVSVAGSGDVGVVVGGVVDNGPAAQAGITAGDSITSVDGTATSTPPALQAALARLHPGDRVAVTWTDGAGSGHRATVTLATGPAD